MKVSIAPGKYVLAVSGGVDSVVLLDVLRQMRGVELVVAHYDHGIRADSAVDRKFVERLATAHGLPYIYENGELGAGASEATARTARYNFLRRIQTGQNAQAIITAHHQDDALETAILNVLRGTGRKGLSALQSRPDTLRPFLHVPKQEIVDYAHRHELQWREDSTNASDRYLRNYVRHHIVPRLGTEGRQGLLAAVAEAEKSNGAIERVLATLLPKSAGELDRHTFIMLPHAAAREVMAAWLRQHDVRDFDRKTIERLVAHAKVAAPGKTADINRVHLLHTGKTALKITPRHLS